MLRSTVFRIPRQLFSSEVSSNAGKRYDIKAGVILKRIPVLLREPTAFEQSYAEYKYQSQQAEAPSYDPTFFETQRMSFLSNSDDKQSKEASGGDVDPRKRFEGIQDVKNLNRHLDRSLYLIVKKPRQEFSWQFPQGKVEAGESLLEAAQRELTEECGDKMSTWFVGNAPVGHYVYDYAKVSDNASGAKSQVFSGQVQLDNKEVVDFAWLTKEELRDYLDSRYYETIKDCLADL